jgi:hypothetical protein
LDARKVHGKGGSQRWDHAVYFQAARFQRCLACELSLERGQQLLDRDGSLHGRAQLTNADGMRRAHLSLGGHVAQLSPKFHDASV